MRTIIQSFALGIIISTIILALVYFLHINNEQAENATELNEEDARELLEEKGYAVVLSSDYNDAIDQNESLKNEIITIEQQLDELKDELNQVNHSIENENNDEEIDSEETEVTGNEEVSQEDVDENEEIEEDVIPKEYLRSLIDPLLFHLTTYEDDYGNEWLFAVATQPDDVNHLLYATCFKNNEPFTGWIPEE